MIKKGKIPTIIGLVVLLVGVFAGVFFINLRQIFRIGAVSSAQPRDVRISNISDRGATISWTTDTESSGLVAWGESQGNLNKVEAEDVGNEKFLTHNISLSGLNPATTYYFKINSGGNTHDNSGVPWEFSTGQVLGTNSNSSIISGSVINASGQPATRAIVYITVGGYLASTSTSTTGNFVYQLGNIRTPDLIDYAQINPATTLLEISVIGGRGDVSSVQMFPQSANPIPPIILGNIYDFRNQPQSTSDQNPNVQLNLPENITGESKFDVSGTSSAQTTKTVILESHDEGEIVTSTQPEFFGKGPGGETITIEVQSENPITSTVTIPQNGSWSWAVPSNLTPGAHTITITWKDASGITRLLKRNFVVQASELPSFEATPSQTILPSASPTATPKATSTPSATPRAAATSSAAPVPVTGTSTSTLLLSIMGIAIVLFSFITWKHAQSTN